MNMYKHMYIYIYTCNMIHTVQIIMYMHIVYVHVGQSLPHEYAIAIYSNVGVTAPPFTHRVQLSAYM